ncbi:MAG: GNAT family N-acetyltransferase [Treponema sp.]|jgi:phosphinothricin acetyltransferase|nr:GNAT family N-acetyltransferase [Treponema sp.]
MIRFVKTGDASAICAIYNHYIKHTVITFEEIPVSPEEMESRIQNISASYPWLVWEEEKSVLGYAYINKWKDRSAYNFSVEDSVYLKQGCEKQGIGRKLLTGLLEEARNAKVHAIVAGICIPNEPSVSLHEKLGFKKAAHFEQVGFKFNQWLDVGYWELLLPKAS